MVRVLGGRVMGMFSNGFSRWFHNSLNVLKITELYTLHG